MESIDLCGGERGAIWSRKPKPRQRDGFLISISNTRIGLTAQGRRVPFTKVAFGSHGSWFVSADQLGVVYCFDISRNRYQVITRLGQTCTAILCSHTHPSQLFIATADLNVLYIDIDSRQLICRFGAHDAFIKSLSLHQNGRYLLVVTACDSVLWDIDTGNKCRTLCGGETVGVQDVFFLPMSNSILTCFKDDSIHAWEANTLTYNYLLPTPSGPTPHYRSFATTQNGQLLVAGGRSNYLHIWNMTRHVLQQVIQLPPKIKNIKQLLFVPNSFDVYINEILGILAQDGILRFITITDCKQLFQLGCKEDALISFAAVDSVGHNIVAISEQGNLLMFDISQLLKYNHTSTISVPDAIKLEQSPSSTVSKLHVSTSTVSTKLTVSTKEKTSTDVTSTVEGVSLNLKRLRAILKGYGEYPAKYRTFIWRSLLHLPDNHSSYSALLDKGTHDAYVDLSTRYPIKSQKLLRILQRTLSTLAHWTPLFSEVEYLPALIFPFVKLFQNNQLVIFEILATILFNWCSHWFEYFPNPPLNILALLENLLSYHDPHLLQHFIKHNITSQVYSWPLLQTLFSEVLSKEEWLKLWDNIISQPPHYLLMICIAYISSARQSLLKCTTIEDVKYFVTHQSSVNLNIVLQDAYRMYEATPTDIHPRKSLGDFVPLTKGTYPIFNKYPTYIVDYQLREKEKIRKEEQEYLRQRQQTLQLEKLTEQRRQEEEAWQRQQDLLLSAEEQRKKMLDLEEQKLLDQRARLAAMKREVRVKELKSLDDARRRYLEQQENIRENEIRKMDKEIERKVLQRDRETQEAIEEVELRSLELQAQRSRMEQEMIRRHDIALHKLRTRHDIENESDPILPPLDSLTTDLDREKYVSTQTELAKVQTDKNCRADEELMKITQEIRSIQRELKEQELKDKIEEYNLRKKKLEEILLKLQMNEKESSSNSDDTEDQFIDEKEGAKWMEQRNLLDKEEAQLLNSVHNLRRRVAQHMKDSSSSFKN